MSRKNESQAIAARFRVKEEVREELLKNSILLKQVAEKLVEDIWDKYQEDKWCGEPEEKWAKSDTVVAIMSSVSDNQVELYSDLQSPQNNIIKYETEYFYVEFAEEAQDDEYAENEVPQIMTRFKIKEEYKDLIGGNPVVLRGVANNLTEEIFNAYGSKIWGKHASGVKAETIFVIQQTAQLDDVELFSEMKNPPENIKTHSNKYFEIEYIR